MSFIRMTKNLNYISALDDEPNDVGGLTATQLKAEFDKAGNEIKNYLNNQLLTEFESKDAASSIGAKSSSGLSSTVQSVIDMKVDKVTGMSLSKNDYSDTEKSKVTSAYNDKHTHSNKAVIDSISAISQVLGRTADRIPSEAAVADAIDNAPLLPPGGAAGKALKKRSSANYDAEWGDITAAAHAYSHSKNGADRISPSDIGAEPVDSSIMRVNRDQSMTSFLHLLFQPSSDSHAVNKAFLDFKAAKPNLIVNGGFQVWRNGNAFNSPGFFTADLWKLNATHNMLAVERIDSGLVFANSSTGQIAALTYTDSQILSYLSGKVVTLSLLCPQISGTAIVKVSHNTAALLQVSLTPGLNAYTISLPASLTHPLTIEIILNPNSSIQMQYVKLEEGEVHSVFLRRSYAEELMLCQMFGQNDGVLGDNLTSKTSASVAASFTGNNASDRFIAIGFTPSAVLISLAVSSGKSALAVQGSAISSNIVAVTNGGFNVKHVTNTGFNASGETYNYIAWR